ncbi:MAG TPA: sulfatase [Actinomycetota bacterium]|nr:sulfatase [Actinomycetota bacterium]
MWRGRALALAVVTSVVSAAWPGAAAPAAAAGARRPDIILIVTDDQRADTLWWLPTVRREIAARGRTFARAMVPTSVCCPSRASILTGEFAHTTKVWSNDGGWRRFVGAGMESDTVAVWLRRSGYRTGLVGKYLNGFTADAPPVGWAVWHSFLGTNGDYYGYELLHTDGHVTRHGSTAADYSTDVLRRRAVGFLRSTSPTRPLFLYFAAYAPHGPATPAPRHATLPAPIGSFSPPDFNEADVSDKPAWIRRLPRVDPDVVRALRIQQYRSLRAVDEAVAAMIRVQRERGRLHRTLLLFVSDNGDMWGEHRVSGKFVPYRGATRVPMAIAWPGHVPAGTTDRRLALNLDLPATIAAAARASHDPIAGRDLLRGWVRGGFVLEAARADVPGGNGTNVERPSYCGWRTGRFLFVHYGNGREELYDYASDPWELSDVHSLARYRDRTLAFRRHARRWCDPVPPGFSWG